MMQTPSESLTAAFSCLRSGDRPGARTAAERALRENPDDPSALAFMGFLLCQDGIPSEAIAHLRRAIALWPDDLATRINLATALVEVGELDEVESVCAGGQAGEIRLRRLMGYVHQQRGDHIEACAAYEAVVAALPQDFESWNNLGNARAALGKHDEAVAAFRIGIRLRRDVPALPINLAKVLAEADRDPERRDVLREAVRHLPANAEVQMELGLAEAATQDKSAAERAFRNSISLTSGFTPAYLELGLLLENLNRIDDLKALVAEAGQRGVAAAEIGFIQAWSLRREGRFAEAMALAEAVPETISPLRRAQLIAELSDRLGHSDRAIKAFEDMNRLSLEQARPIVERSSFGDDVSKAAKLITKRNIAKWRNVEVRPTPPSPVFLVGFPRSGTTLLDTLLMNVPQFHVMEELPVMRQPEVKLGDAARLASVGTAEVNALRAHYYEALAHIAPPPRRGMTIVDKFPLHMARMPLIHRLFPDAKVVMVERHPCDVVLSCFMSNFTLNRAMRHFTTLEGAARLYDTVFDAWTRAIENLPISVHYIRYERMVDNLEAEMRSLLNFLDLPWDSSVLDNQSSAAKRVHISTASYSQVTEPIYSRSAGRWERYREYLAPVLPILEPWIARMGYTS